MLLTEWCVQQYIVVDMTMNTLKTILVVLPSILTLSCDDLRVSAFEVRPGEEIQVSMKEGSDIFLTPDNLTVRFIKMMTDSRCPKNVVCFWPGLAVIRVDITRDTEQPTVLLLVIPGLVTTPYRRNSTEASGYSITLLQLDPYPVFQSGNGPAVYEALLAIEKIKTRSVVR